MSIVTTWTARAAVSILPGVVGRLPVRSKTIFLTFDDGPSERTVELIELLSAFDARATFFLQGNQIERHQSGAEKIFQNGHGIGNHSFCHLDAWKNTWTSIRRDLEAGSKSIADLTGSEPRWMRPPYGRVRPSMMSWSRDRGQRMALWDVMADDFLLSADEEAIANAVVAQIRPGSLLVLHDGDAHQPRSLVITERVLRSLSDQGWSCERLPDSEIDYRS